MDVALKGFWELFLVQF